MRGRQEPEELAVVDWREAREFSYTDVVRRGAKGRYAVRTPVGGGRRRMQAPCAFLPRRRTG